MLMKVKGPIEILATYKQSSKILPSVFTIYILSKVQCRSWMSLLAEGSTKAEIFRKSVWWRSGLINLGVTPVEGVGLKSDLSYLRQQHTDIPRLHTTYIAATYICSTKRGTLDFCIDFTPCPIVHSWPQKSTLTMQTLDKREIFEYCRAHRSQHYYPIAIIARFIHWHFPNTLYFRLARSTTNPSATAHTLTHMGCMHTIE